MGQACVGVADRTTSEAPTGWVYNLASRAEPSRAEPYLRPHGGRVSPTPTSSHCAADAKGRAECRERERRSRLSACLRRPEGGAGSPHSPTFLSSLPRAVAGLALAVSLIAGLAVGVTGQAQAQTEVASDWSLKPSSLSSGDRFRLLAVTSTTRDATSADIADYNSHVQNAVNSGHSKIRRHSSSFRVLGCTASTNAKANTGTTGTGVPIYWLNGAKAADDYADLYDGSWDSNSPRDEDGDTVTSNRVFTGCEDDGDSDITNMLGPGTVISTVYVGNPTSNGNELRFVTNSKDISRPFYALSPVFVVSANTVPGEPRSLTATARGPTRIDLEWLAPSSNGGSPVTGYRIEVSDDNSTWTELVPSYSDTTYYHTGLTAGTTKYYRVSAINKLGTGSPQGPVSATTPSSGVTPPVQVSVRSDWSLKPSALSSGDRFRLLAVTSTTRDATSADIADYNSHVQNAVNSGHSKIRRHSSSFRVLGCTASTNAKANTGTTGTGVPIYWLNGAKAADDYADLYDGSWDSNSPRDEDGNTVTSNRVFTGCEDDGDSDITNMLGPGTVISTVYVGNPTSNGNELRFVTNSKDISRPFYALSPVFVVSANTVPGEPRSLTATARGPTRIDLAWLAPSSNGGSPITGYRIEVSDDNATWTELVPSQAGTTYSHTDLTLGTTNYYRVFAINRLNTGPAAGPVSATTALDNTAPTLSTAEVTAARPKELVLTYNEPLDESSAPDANRYTVKVTPQGGGTRTTGVLSAFVSGSAVTLELEEAVVSGEAVKVTYRVPPNLRVQDLAGNPAGAFNERTVTNNAPPCPATGLPSSVFWSACLKVGGLGPGRMGFQGFEGGLSDKTFTRGGAGYEVDALFTDSSGLHLSFTTDPRPASDLWQLHVGDRWYPLAGVDYDGGGHTLTVSGPGFTWNDREHGGDKVPVSLRPFNAVPTVANPIPDRSAIPGTELRYQFPANTFADRNNDTLSYTATKADGTALPAWLGFDGPSRTFSGTPQLGDVGTFEVKVTADDGTGGRASDIFRMTVARWATPVVAWTGPLSGEEGTTLRFEAVLLHPVTLQRVAAVAPVTAGWMVNGYGKPPYGASHLTDIAPRRGTLTFAAGESSAVAEVRLVEDSEPEASETFQIGFTRVTNATEDGRGARQAVLGTIEDDDGALTVSYVRPASVTEVREGSTVEVAVRLGEPAMRRLEVGLYCELVDAARGDFSGVPSSVTFEAGQQEATFTFRAVRDRKAESDEWLAFGFGRLPPGLIAVDREGVVLIIANGRGGTETRPGVSDPLNGDCVMVADHPELAGQSQPAAPSGLRASAAAGGTVDLAWTLPSQPAGVTVSGTAVQQRSNEEWATVAELDPGAVSHRLTGLVGGRSYAFRVRLDTSWGAAASAPVETSVPVAAAAPSPATGLAASNATATTVDLAWTLPAQSAGVTVTAVEVQRQGSDGTWSTVATLAADAASHTVTGLVAQTSYSFRIRVVAGEVSADSGAVQATTAPSDTDAVRSGATALDVAAAVQEPWYLRDRALDRAGGDAVDYYTFTLTARKVLGLGVRGQSIDLDVHLEDENGARVASSSPPQVDPDVEWLKRTLEPGTYYVRVEAAADGATPYYVRFGLKDPPPADADATRDGATALDAAAAAQSVQYYRNKSLDRANGDRVDYYVFTLTGRKVLELGIRGQSIDLDASVENDTGTTLMRSWPPPRNRSVEWLKMTLDAGTYYVRVEAMENGATDYYVRFGLKDAAASLSVADASAEEGTDATLDFQVTLDRNASATVTVAFATSDGSATAGDDYTARSGTLTFLAGERTKTVSVPVLDDSLNEGEETMTLRLTNPQGASLADGVATGTISNSDPLQAMWLARFGRTVADHVTAAVSDRLSGPLAGARVTVGGETVDLAETQDEAFLGRTLTSIAQIMGAPSGPGQPANDPGSVSGAGSGSGPLGAGPGAAPWPGTGLGLGDAATATSAPGRLMTGRELLLGSAFHLAKEGDGGRPGLAAWGRVTVGGFDGEAPADSGTVRVDGEVATGILGTDAEWHRLLAGVAVSVSEGEGRFDQPGVDSGTVESTMTVVSPYARVNLSDRISVWGLAGYGTGGMTIVQNANEATGQPERVSKTDLSMRLAALGGRGALLTPDEAGGFDLALKADGFFVETTSEAISNEGDTSAEASRVRLALEGSRAFQVGGGVFTPGLELGLRHDGGDAETGTGVELGGKVSYADPETGLSVDASVRALVAHEDSKYREWGASGALRLAPGERGRGLSFSLAPTYGTAGSGVDRLWSARDARGLAPTGGTFEPESRLEGELGYGMALFGDRFTGTPNVGFGLTGAGARDYRIGWRLTSVVRGDPGFRVDLDATRREPANDNGAGAPEHGVMLRAAIRW